MDRKNHNADYFYSGYDNNDEEYNDSGFYGGTEKDKDYVEAEKGLADQETAKKTVIKSLTLIASAAVTIFSVIGIYTVISGEIIPAVTFGPNVLQIVTAAVLVVFAIYSVYMLIWSLKNHKKLIHRDIICIAVFSLLAAVINGISKLISPPSKILFIILMVLLAVGMAVIIVGLVKNRYIPAVIFVSGLYIILAAFLSLTVFIIPVFVPVVDFNAHYCLITSDKDLVTDLKIEKYVEPEMERLRDFENGYDFQSAYPLSEIVSSRAELDKYLNEGIRRLEEDEIRNPDAIEFAKKIKDILTKQTKDYDDSFFENNFLVICNDTSNYMIDNYTVEAIYPTYIHGLIYVKINQHCKIAPKDTDYLYYNDGICYVFAEMPKQKLQGIQNYIVVSNDVLSLE